MNLPFLGDKYFAFFRGAFEEILGNIIMISCKNIEYRI